MSDWHFSSCGAIGLTTAHNSMVLLLCCSSLVLMGSERSIECQEGSSHSPVCTAPRAVADGDDDACLRTSYVLGHAVSEYQA